ncbi:MAG: LemA family protein [Planctomycetes bacterium]|nr:LemA family protein [Planctomycetota bacterium]
MPAPLVALGVAVLAIALLGIWLMAIYNALVSWRVRVQNGFAQIDVQLRRRHDLVPNLVAAVKGAMAHERETLEGVTKARAAAVSAQAAAAAIPGDAAATATLAAAEAGLQSALSRLMIVMERYPDLKANSSALQLQEELVSTENRIAFARQAYNDAVMTYNTRLAVFPDLLVARLFSFLPAGLFEAEDHARAVPQVDFASAPPPRAG